MAKSDKTPNKELSWNEHITQVLETWVKRHFPKTSQWIGQHRILSGAAAAIFIWIGLAVVGAVVGEIATRGLFGDQPVLPTSATITVVYGDASGLTVVVNEDSRLEDVRLVTLKNRSLPARLSEDFRGVIHNGIISKNTCLIYQAGESASALPRACRREGVIVASPVLTDNPFWYDDSAMLPLQIERITDGFNASCTPAEGSCLIAIPSLEAR